MTTIFTAEQHAELVAAMDAVMRMCAGRPKGDWHTAAITHMEAHGATYDETIRWLSTRIGTCGSSGAGPLPDFHFGPLSLHSDVQLYSHHLRQKIIVQRGDFLRTVFPDPTRAHQLLLF